MQIGTVATADRTGPRIATAGSRGARAEFIRKGFHANIARGAANAPGNRGIASKQPLRTSHYVSNVSNRDGAWAVHVVASISMVAGISEQPPDRV